MRSCTLSGVQFAFITIIITNIWKINIFSLRLILVVTKILFFLLNLKESNFVLQHGVINRSLF